MYFYTAANNQLGFFDTIRRFHIERINMSYPFFKFGILRVKLNILLINMEIYWAQYRKKTEKVRRSTIFLNKSVLQTCVVSSLQALKAAEISPMKWDCNDAVRNLLKTQNKETGAFHDSLGATLAIMPTIAHMSLADLKYIKPECGNPHKGKTFCH